MKLDPVGIALLLRYILLCLFYCIQIEKEKSNICQFICNFLCFQTTSLRCMIISSILCPEEVNCWVGNLFHKYYQELLNYENVEDRYSYIQRNKWPDDNLIYIYIFLSKGWERVCPNSTFRKKYFKFLL